MERIQPQTRHHDQHPLKPDKHPLVPHQRPIPPLAQLRHPIHRPPKDAHGRERQRRQQAAEAHAAARGDSRGRLVEGGVGAEGAAAPPHAQGKVGRGEDEEEEGQDLEGEAGDHDAVARGGGVAVVRGDGGEGAARGLEDEGDDVAGDELERGG